MDHNVKEIVMAAILGGGTMVTVIVFAALNTWKKVEFFKADAKVKASREAMDAVDALQREIVDLRDTTTRYDMSFDAALQRIESRVTHLERQSMEGAVQRVGER